MLFDASRFHSIPFFFLSRRPEADVGSMYLASDPAGIYKVQTIYGPVPLGSIYRINTGAPLPPGTDAVVMVEDTLVTARKPTASGEEDTEGEECEVNVLAQVDAGENLRNPGTDVKAGEKVLEKGDAVSGVGGELATLAFIGKRSVCFPFHIECS